MPAVHKIRLDDPTIEYTVRRSRRRKKTVEITISQGVVSVAAPLRTPNREIQEIVKRRSGWILKKLAESNQDILTLFLESGATVPFLGRELPLVVEAGEVRRPSARLDQERLVIAVPEGLAAKERSDQAEAALVDWYREKAREFLTDSVARWLPVMGRTDMPTVLVRSQRTRWGSCSSDGTLRFSWRLAMLEPDLIDSVVVHELAHLDVMNHSPAFWNVVIRAMPDARERRRRLNEAGRRLPL